MTNVDQKCDTWFATHHHFSPATNEKSPSKHLKKHIKNVTLFICSLSYRDSCCQKHIEVFDKKYELVCHIFIHLSIIFIMLQNHGLCLERRWVIVSLCFCKREKENILCKIHIFFRCPSDEFHQHNVDLVSENKYCLFKIYPCLPAGLLMHQAFRISNIFPCRMYNFQISTL